MIIVSEQEILIFNRMNRAFVRTLTFFLIIIAIILQAIGGLFDLMGKPTFITKEHAWMDASFIILLATLLNVMV
jgi:hypothetical protein